MAQFRWNAWNVEHIARHGIEPEHAERIVQTGHRRRIGNGKYKAIGRCVDGSWIQAIYIFDPPGVVYVLHARALTESEKRRMRKRLK